MKHIVVMKRFVIILLVLSVCSHFSINAQNISLKSVSLNRSDLRASTSPRTDNKTGKFCAIIKVDIIGVKDLEFVDAIGDVDYNLGEYIVYVPEGIKELKYKNASGSISGVINFDDYSLEVETKRVYNVVFESENHIRAAKFSIQPQEATLLFDGKAISLDKNGLASIEKPIGKYVYHVEANGYESQSDTVELLEDEIFTTTIVKLKKKSYPLTITCSPSDATLFIDNVPYGKLNERNELTVPEGEHMVRLTATGYEDYEQTVNVRGQALAISASLQKTKEQTVKYKDERTRTSVNIRNSAYLSIGGELFNKAKYEGHKWGLKADLSFMQHFGALFAIREGLGGGIMFRDPDWIDENYGEKADTVKVSWFLEIPLQLGASFPFGKYNRHLFSVLGGGYGRVIFTDYISTAGNDVRETLWDFGLCVTAQIDIKKFVIGGDFCSSLKGRGFFYGVKIAIKF